MIDSARMLNTIRTLSSDEFEGRSPGTRGEDLTTAFIEEQFKKAGLVPGNPDGTYVQKVPLVYMKAERHPRLVCINSNTGQEKALAFLDDFIVGTKREQPEIDIASDLIFVGYGIVAPEYNWNDFKDVDVKGKIIVVLVNDPPVPDPNDPLKLDEKTFKGKAMTYYGRWTYKFEEAARRGALGCLIVHQNEPAGYPWEVLRSGNAFEQFCLQTEDKGMSSCAAEGWMTYEAAKTLFSMGGHDFDALERAAMQRNFRPVDLRLKASISLRNTIKSLVSKNVVGKIVGSDPKLRDECVVYTAHWDHLGVDPILSGDNIYHGAVDNATGVSALIEIGNFLQHQPPRRSILFVATTGEERGLLGAQYYTEHPLVPIAKTVANINIDGLNVWGLTTDVEVIGLGQSTLDQVIEEVAREQKRVAVPDGQPEKGHFYRADHVWFAKYGVPTFSIGRGLRFVGKPDGWGKAVLDKFTREDYHKPSDTIKPDWDLTGMAQDVLFLGEVGCRVANADTYRS